MSDPFATVTAELPRDRWGRPLITPPEGGDPTAYTRVTTFVKALDDTFHLGKWQMRMTALGMSVRRDLVLAAVAITNPDDQNQKKTLNRIAESALEASKAHARAEIGTALHSFSERIDRGDDLGEHVPEEYLADLQAYREIRRYLGDVVAMEGFCVVDSLRIGGSYDRIFRFTEESLATFEREKGHRLAYPDGTEVQPGDTIIGDLKTGKSIDFGIGGIAMQLATYANAEDYDHTLGSRTPVPVTNKKWAVVIHLPAGKGTASLVWVDIESAWHTVTTVVPQVHAWRKRRDLSYAFASATAAPTAGPTLPEQIRTATSPEALRALYAANAMAWTPGLTSLATARIAELGK